MKITIKKEVPASLQWEDAPADQKTDKASRGQKKKGAEKSKTAIISKEVEIADELLDKVIAVIDEILDRTRDDLENRSWKKLDFPLVPFPFLDKYRDPDRYGIDDYWIGVWLNTDLQGVISERAKIINFLNQAEALWIEHDPVVNLLTGNFRGEKFELSIERDKLLAVRKEAVEHKEGKDTLEALFGLAPLDGSKKSVYYDRARNLDELLRDVELRNRCLDLLHWGREFGKGKFLKTSISERDGNDDLVLLLENLGLLRADWKGLKDQLAYKEIGARNIEVTIDGTKVSDLVDRAEGKMRNAHSLNNALAGLGIYILINQHGSRNTRKKIERNWSSRSWKRLAKKIQAAAVTLKDLPTSHAIQDVHTALLKFERFDWHE